MGYTIAIAGKGGTGKTTITALLVRLLKDEKKGSILAVDADPNSNLAEALGIKPEETIGSILDEIAAHPQKIPSGMPKDRFIEFQIHKAIQESDGFDVLTMGKPEGPGCYCYVNNVLRNIMATLIKDYDYVIIDNEAGLEHLSRRTTRACEALLVVSDPTVIGLRSARRINELAKDLDIKVKKRILVVNRSNGAVNNPEATDTGLTYLGNIPEDEGITEISLKGGSILELADNAAGITAMRKLR